MVKHRSEYSLGVIFLLVSVLTYSTAGIFTKSVEAGVWSVIFWRGLFAVLFTTGWTIQRKTFRTNFFDMGKSGWLVGVVGAIGTAAFISAFKLTSIANVSLIYATAPLVSALLAWYWIGEQVTRRTLFGSIGALFGVFIIVWGSFGHLGIKGDGLALVMTIAMATIMVIYRKFPSTPGAGPSALQSLLLMPAALAFGNPFTTDSSEILVLAAFGLLFAIASVALAEGSKRIPAGQTALLSALETPIAPILALAIFREVPNSETFIGGSIVLTMVIFSTRSQQANAVDCVSTTRS